MKSTTTSGMKEIKEGSARLVVGKDDVFYNNVQCVNRDLSVLALNVFCKQLKTEREEHEKWRVQRLQSWRKSVPTWDAWGVPKPPKQEDEERAGSGKGRGEGKHGGGAGGVGMKHGGAGNNGGLEMKGDAAGPGSKGDAAGRGNKGHADDPAMMSDAAGPGMKGDAAGPGMKGDAARPEMTDIATPGTKHVDDTPDAPKDETVRILEALSASGLRSIRYAKEVVPEMKKHIVANDLNSDAVESIKKHAQENGPYLSGTVIESSLCDAIDYMHARRTPKSTKFHVVDLDPYGAPTPFLDSAVQCVENGGLLCVTATDTAVLCGSYQDKCRPKYGGVALKRPFAHEMAIRLLLACIDTHANRHGKFIVPLLSLKIDFYIRVFVRVYGDHANEVKLSGTRLANVLQSKQTDTFRIIPLLENDNGKIAPPKIDFDVFKESPESGAIGGWMMGGPIWAAPMQNMEFVKACLEKMKAYNYNKSSVPIQFGFPERVEGMLGAVKEELLDVPLFYHFPSLFQHVHCSSPPLEKFQAALMNAGYRVSQCHFDPSVLKTDAPNRVVWDILRCWVEKHPVSAKRMEEDPVTRALLSVKPETRANFDSPRELRAVRAARKDKKSDGGQARWHQNPEPGWGPKSAVAVQSKRGFAVVSAAAASTAAAAATTTASSPEAKRVKPDQNEQ